MDLLLHVGLSNALTATLLAVVALKRSGGGSFRNLLESVGPSTPAPRPAATAGAPTYHLRVVPGAKAADGGARP